MDAAMVAAIVEAQFPELAPARVTFLGAGCDSTAFDINGAWVFRFPARTDVEDQLHIETRTLPVLAARLPVPVPVFRFVGRPSAAFPRHFAGYRRLPGSPAILPESATVPLQALAAPLARSLSALHAVPIDVATALGVPEQPIDATIEEVRADALADFHLLSGVAPDAPLDRWYAYLKAGPEPVDTRVPLAPVHNDLAAEHVLVDAASYTITGIIDWSDVALSDPAADFAGLFHWGGDAFVRQVLSTYEGRMDQTRLARARFMGACRGVGDVAFGLETGRREYVASGVRALHHCAGGNGS